jgi:hypothetical protein
MVRTQGLALHRGVLRIKPRATWRNRIEDMDMNPCSYTYLIFDKGAKNIQWR